MGGGGKALVIASVLISPQTQSCRSAAAARRGRTRNTKITAIADTSLASVAKVAMAQEGKLYSLETQLRAARADLESYREETLRLREGLRRCISHIRLTHSALRGRILLLPERLSAAQRGKGRARAQARAATPKRATTGKKHNVS